MFKEYTQYDALALAALVNSGELSAKELLDAAVYQANKLNPKLNAIIHRFDERAYNAAQAGLPSGVFTGVPYLLKDLSFSFAGEPITMGSRSVTIPLRKRQRNRQTHESDRRQYLWQNQYARVWLDYHH
ncbi:hypothetical protein PKHYL_06930 [Psychrobacter sp. KH172YL61]|uniref:amidase family protein n=1 Tax=Psychrobacter sp. KH172YL61 TaxID=2517899 RepID=UPI0010AF81C1|nr:amidase family protein [Psychrobacter sp. KH172YL61]BBI66502.1 hypothetical protein PKHYL_06930 [Psychrobacter sp. KH172YL61]